MVVTDKRTLHVASKIDRVTLYKDKAQIFRVAEVAFPEGPGDYSLRWKGEWSAVTRDSVQVGVSRDGAASIVLRAVQFTSETSVIDVSERVAEAGRAVKVAEKAERDAADKVALVDTALSMLGKLREKALQTPSAKPSLTVYDLAKWEELSKYFDEQRATYTKQKRELDREHQKARQERSNAQSRFNGLTGNSGRVTTTEYAEVLVTLLQPATAPIVLTLSYMANNASWSPLYDVRVNRTERTVALTYNATVKQQTREDWRDVRLSLSTARPHVGGDPPSFPTWALSIRPKYVPQSHFYGELEDRSLRSLSAASAPAPQMMMQQMMVTNMMPAAAPAAPPPRPKFSEAAPVAAAEVTAGTTSATFTIAALASVASDNQPVRVTIAQLSFAAYFRYSAVPKLDQHVYLKVKAKNTSAFTLLAGKSNVFSDQQFVCASQLVDVAPNEEFWTFLGVDEDLSCTRTTLHTKRTDTAGFFGGKKVTTEYSYKFNARNGKSTAEELVIWDQMPITQSDKLTCTLVTPKRGDGVSPHFEINNVQFIEWIVNLKPAEERTFDYVYALEHPLGERINFSGS